VFYPTWSPIIPILLSLNVTHPITFPHIFLYSNWSVLVKGKEKGMTGFSTAYKGFLRAAWGLFKGCPRVV
jgi:hypothetical protein